MKFNLQPSLNGERLMLHPLKLEDFEALFKAASDPLIWELHPEPTRYQRDVFQKYFDGAMESGGAFAVREQKTHQIIGSSRYYDFDREKNQIIIGYTFLTRPYWGGSYNREMKKLMLEHAFQFVKRVLFEVGEKNIRSRCAMEKIGGQLIARAERDGKNHVIYAIDSSAYSVQPL